MQIQSINKSVSQPIFNAKLSPKSLKILTEESGRYRYGNEVLKRISDRLGSFGNKETVLDFSSTTKPVDVNNSNETSRKIILTISNYLFPSASYNHSFNINTNENLFKFLERMLYSSRQDFNIRNAIELGEMSFLK